jgi:SAM-dependent methyltransferase
MSRQVYDTIGRGYAAERHTDPRIEAPIRRALGEAARVVNVGAGTGSYEPVDRFVIAVEPSTEMIAQRAAGAAPVVRGVAEALPFADGRFDAAMAILTMHHWTDWQAGIAEARRVAGRLVIFTATIEVFADNWLVADYFPGIIDIDRDRFPTTDELAVEMGGATVGEVLVPRDCVDGFTGAYWARPEAYLSPDVRRGMSGFAALDPDVVAKGLERLAGDLESGRWDERYGALRTQDMCDIGYRLLVS